MHMWTCPPHVRNKVTPHIRFTPVPVRYVFLYFLLTAYFVVGMWVPNMSNILITPVLFSPE